MRAEVPADQVRRGKASKMQLTGIPLLLGEEIDEIGIKKEHMESNSDDWANDERWFKRSCRIC